MFSGLFSCLSSEPCSLFSAFFFDKCSLLLPTLLLIPKETDLHRSRHRIHPIVRFLETVTLSPSRYGSCLPGDPVFNLSNLVLPAAKIIPPPQPKISSLSRWSRSFNLPLISARSPESSPRVPYLSG